MISKQAWRRWAAGLTTSTRSSMRMRRAIEAWLPPGVSVLLYLPMPGEPDIADVAQDHRRLITRTPDEGPLTVHAFDAPREVHRWGFAQPRDGSPPVPASAIDVVLVPGALFARDGARLGHGKGYYDRLLAGVRPEIPRVGVAGFGRLVERLPTEPHDVPMTHLVTERGVRPVPLVD